MLARSITLAGWQLLFQKRMVRCACFLTSNPPGIPQSTSNCVHPKSVRRASDPKVVELLLGAFPVYTRQPFCSLLMAVLPACQVPQPLAGFGTAPTTLARSQTSARSARLGTAWFAKTSSTISEMVCSLCNDFSFQAGRRHPVSILRSATHLRSL